MAITPGLGGSITVYSQLDTRIEVYLKLNFGLVCQKIQTFKEITSSFRSLGVVLLNSFYC